MAKIIVDKTEISVITVGAEDYLSLTDMAKFKSDEPAAVISNWIRNRNTIEYLGLWEILYNPIFKPLEFEEFRRQAGLNAFTLSPQKWINATNASGIVCKSGRYGGTFAHKDIAFKFAGWLSVEFELYVAKEFQRMKASELKMLGWSVKRELAKINYHIHTDAIKENLIPQELTQQQIYPSTAVVLPQAVTDIDGNSYDAVQIGNQVWMAENLRTTRYADGTVIPMGSTYSTTDPCRSFRGRLVWASGQMPRVPRGEEGSDVAVPQTPLRYIWGYLKVTHLRCSASGLDFLL